MQLNLDLVNPVQHRDSLKVARVQKCHPGDNLATTLAVNWREVARLSPGCRLVVASTYSALIDKIFDFE